MDKQFCYMRKFKLFPAFWLCILASLLSFSASAQKKTVTGIVSDETGAPIVGATIAAMGEKTTVVTGNDGIFKINVQPNTKKLRISFVGTETQEVSIEGKTNLLVTQKTTSTKLTEVVTVGYGTRRRSEVTSAISSVSEKDIKNLPVAGIDQAIQGKVAGVTVTNNSGQPGGGVSVRVRGITSVNGNEPLYVIDGVPLAAETNSLEQNVLGGGSGQTVQSVLATLNPNDIASIDILKDAAAQAIYGSRAANGVVLVTTKKGKSGEGKITYDTYYGWQEVAKMLPVMNLQQYAGYLNSLVPEVRAAGTGMDSIGEFRDPSLLGKGTDWQNEIYQRGTMNSHQLSFSGGQGKTNYFFSGGYFDHKGVLLNTNLKRYTLRLNINHSLRSWLRAGISANMSRSNQRLGLSDGFDAATSVVLYNSPASPIRDANGNFISNSIIQNQTFGNPTNPVALTTLRDVRAVTSKIFGAVFAEIDLIKGLTYRTEVNYDFTFGQNKALQPFVKNEATGGIILSPSRLREQRNNSAFWALKNYVNYSNGYRKHWFYLTAGHEANGSSWDYVAAKRDNLTLNLPSLNAGAGGNGSGETIDAGAGDWAMESFFGRLNYTYDNRYALNVSYRADGSSSFGPDNRWGQFKGASASWTLTNEKFGKDIKYLDYLKLRVGIGEVGNQNVGANLYSANINLYNAGPFGSGGIPRNVPNPKLGWETVTTYNAGIDVTLLKRKIDLTVDVYKKVTTDMFLPTQLGAFSGLGTNWNDIWTPTTNDGQMTNTGIDITITSHNISRPHLTWNTTFTFSHYKNVLDRLNTPEATIKGELDEYGTKSLLTLTRQGTPVGSFFGYVTNGIFRTMAELNNGTNWGLPVAANQYWLGDIRYADLDGNNIIDDKDVAVIGNPNPKFTAGLTNSVSYKGFDLSVFLYVSYGADIFNYTRRQTEGMTTAWNNQLSTVLDRYTASNPNSDMPRYNQWHNNNIRVSDRYIEDGSYLRIQNLSLGYNLPKKYIAKAKMASARIYASVQNLYTFTNYSGYDPELGAYNNRVTFMNVDNGHYPMPRTFTIGANIEF